VTQNKNRFMKVSDYIAEFLFKNGINDVFIVSGGASIHLLHSINNHPFMKTIHCHHEQAASMAADGYARVNSNFGCAIATSGPGATNLITGITGAWFDSIPVLHITGQVATFRMKNNMGVRQYGFQETDIVSMTKAVTKYSKLVLSSSEIRLELEKALYLMKLGRPGPALIDIPDDIQRQVVDTSLLKGFEPSSELSESKKFENDNLITKKIGEIINNLLLAERPVLILGAGANLPENRRAIEYVLKQVAIPVLTTWRGKDLVDSQYEWLCGTFGTHGTRVGNFVVQNSDFVLSIGSRLSTKETGTPISDWARSAKIAMVDIDEFEIKKFDSLGKSIDFKLNVSSSIFLQELIKQLPEGIGFANSWLDWKKYIINLKNSYPTIEKGPKESKNGVSPADMVSVFSNLFGKHHIFLDTGCAVAWVMQGLKVSVGQHIHHDCNNTAMGWALPAAIGGSISLGNFPVICVVGDGSLMMNLQELSTVQNLKLPIGIILINNSGYGMVRQTEDQWLGGVHLGTGLGEQGLSFPNFSYLCEAFEIPYVSVATKLELELHLEKLVTSYEPFFIDVKITEGSGVYPQSKFGFPIEDADPPLERHEFLANMIITPKDISNRER
jgi:acetolactate synthase-1/2/3 large subunit